MTRYLFAVVLTLGVAGAATDASACRWFGTQFECGLGKSEVVLGTQTEAEPTYSRSFHPSHFQGVWHTTDDRTAYAPPVRIELQNIGADPSLCRRFGNETYCY